MSTVVLKWNPSFSSYTMYSFLGDMRGAYRDMMDFNWSVWDHEMIHEGDTFYWLKVGYGQTGIVGRGTITSEPYRGQDWYGRGRKVYYVNFDPEIMLCADAFRLLSSEELQQAIPDFDWFGGHSGVVLTPEQAEKLDNMWDKWLSDNREAIGRSNSMNVFTNRNFKDTLYEEGDVTLRFESDYEDIRVERTVDEVQTAVTIEKPHFVIRDFEAIDVKDLARIFKERYGRPDGLEALCRDLASMGRDFTFDTYHRD